MSNQIQLQPVDSIPTVGAATIPENIDNFTFVWSSMEHYLPM